MYQSELVDFLQILNSCVSVLATHNYNSKPSEFLEFLKIFKFELVYVENK